MIVSLGIDLSLNNSALVATASDRFDYPIGRGPEVVYRESLIPPKGLAGMARLDFIDESWRHAVDTLIHVLGRTPTIAVFEGPGFSSQIAHSLGHVHGLVKLELWRRGVPGLLIGDVPPANLKQFATGKGQCEKQVVMKHVLRRWGFDDDDDNIVDAYVCSLIGLCRVVGDGSELQRKVATQRVGVELYAGTSRRAQRQQVELDRAARGSMAGRVRRRRLA